MYDAAATDSNNVPREGAGISSHWMIPNANPWGLVKGSPHFAYIEAKRLATRFGKRKPKWG